MVEWSGDTFQFDFRFYGDYIIVAYVVDTRPVQLMGFILWRVAI